MSGWPSITVGVCSPTCVSAASVCDPTCVSVAGVCGPTRVSNRCLCACTYTCIHPHAQNHPFFRPSPTPGANPQKLGNSAIYHCDKLYISLSETLLSARIWVPLKLIHYEGLNLKEEMDLAMYIWSFPVRMKPAMSCLLVVNLVLTNLRWIYTKPCTTYFQWKKMIPMEGVGLVNHCKSYLLQLLSH